jgi:hypothetical protein
MPAQLPVPIALRAMSIRLSLTLGLGECSANTRHSAARSLHNPRRAPKEYPAANRGGPAGVQCLAGLRVLGICQVGSSTRERSNGSQNFRRSLNSPR